VAYVFGMEGVPVFEMLFILMVLLLVGLIFVLLEIRKLVNLIAEEKVDIKRFEMDLAQFERDEGKQPPQELVDYVKDAKDKGLSDMQIQTSLGNAGWKDKEVKSIFNKMNKMF